MGSDALGAVLCEIADGASPRTSAATGKGERKHTQNTLRITFPQEEPARAPCTKGSSQLCVHTPTPPPCRGVLYPSLCASRTLPFGRLLVGA